MTFPLLKLTLVFSDFCLLVFLVQVMIGHYRANFNMQSWSTVFHLLCVTWLSIRGLFWLHTLLSTQEWNNMTFHILYWLPNAFEFAAFAIIPMFFAQILYAETWRRYWSYIKPTYVLMIFTICILQIGWGIIAGLSTHCKGTLAGMDPVAINTAPTSTTAGAASGDIEGGQTYQDSSTEYYNPSDTASEDTACMQLEYSAVASRFVAFTLFFGLAVMQAIYGFHISNMPASTYKQYFNNSITFMNFVNSCLLFCFLSRAIYILCTLYGFRLLPAIPLQGHDDVHWSLFLFFEIWDYIPTTLLVLSVTSVPMGYGNIDPFQSFRSFTTLSSPQIKDVTHLWDKSTSSRERGMRNSNGTYGSIGSGLNDASSRNSAVFNQRERSSTEIDMKRYNSGGDSAAQGGGDLEQITSTSEKEYTQMQTSSNSGDNHNNDSWLSRLFGYGNDGAARPGYEVIDESNVMTLEIGSVSSTYTPSSSVNVQPYRVFDQLSPTSSSIGGNVSNHMGMDPYLNDSRGEGSKQESYQQKHKGAMEHHRQQRQHQHQYDINSHSVAPPAGDTSYNTNTISGNSKNSNSDDKRRSDSHSDMGHPLSTIPSRRQTLGVDASRNRDVLEQGNAANANKSPSRRHSTNHYGDRDREPTREEIARRFSLERFSAPESLDPPESWLSGSFRPNQILKSQYRNATISNINATNTTNTATQDTFPLPADSRLGDLTINTKLEVGSIHSPSSWKGSRDISMFEEPSLGSSFTRKGMLDTVHHGYYKASSSIAGGMTVGGVNIPPRIRSLSKDLSMSREMRNSGSNDISPKSSEGNSTHGSSNAGSTRDNSNNTRLVEGEATIGKEGGHIKDNTGNNDNTANAGEATAPSGGDTMQSSDTAPQEGDGLGRLRQERTSIVQDRQMRRSRGNSIGSRQV